MTSENTPILIFSYTRKQAIADGALIDVSATAREAGFRYPVAVTAAVWSKCVAVPDGVEGQDEMGRLWDVLWMLHAAIAMNPRAVGGNGELLYRLCVRNDDRDGEPPLVTLKAVCAGDDDGSPCLTIMLPEED